VYPSKSLIITMSAFRDSSENPMLLLIIVTIYERDHRRVIDIRTPIHQYIPPEIAAPCAVVAFTIWGVFVPM